MKRNNLTGQRFARLEVEGIECVTDKKQNVLWRCRCVCGGQALAYAYDLRNGRVRSCGCLAKEGGRVTHGLSKRPEYAVWCALIQRCTNTNDRNWHNYGGRGIKVCERWQRFENFYSDMCPRPKGKTLERKDNDGPYSPENCVWATPAQQGRNRRGNVWVDFNGTRVILADALRALGKTIGATHYQMNKHGLSHNEVIQLWQQQKKT